MLAGQSGREEFFSASMIEDAVVRNPETGGEAAKRVAPTLRERAGSAVAGDGRNEGQARSRLLWRRSRSRAGLVATEHPAARTRIVALWGSWATLTIRAFHVGLSPGTSPPRFRSPGQCPSSVQAEALLGGAGGCRFSATSSVADRSVCPVMSGRSRRARLAMTGSCDGWIEFVLNPPPSRRKSQDARRTAPRLDSRRVEPERPHNC
jgi:hypothetical protein